MGDGILVSSFRPYQRSLADAALHHKTQPEHPVLVRNALGRLSLLRRLALYEQDISDDQQADHLSADIAIRISSLAHHLHGAALLEIERRSRAYLDLSSTAYAPT